MGRGHCRGPSFQKKAHEVKSQDTSVISRCCVKNCKRTAIIPTFPQLSADLESAFHNKDFADVKVELNSILTIYQRIFCCVWISLNQFYIMNQFEPVLYELCTRWHVVTGYLSATNSCSGGLFVGYSLIYIHIFFFPGKICHFYSSRSPVFRAMFQSDMTEAATKVLPENLTWTQLEYNFHVQRVDIQDLQPDTVNDMLLYIYTGNPQVSPVIKFLAIAILINNLRTWHTELEIYLQLLTNIN